MNNRIFYMFMVFCAAFIVTYICLKDSAIAQWDVRGFMNTQRDLIFGKVRNDTSQACNREYQNGVCNMTCFEIFWLKYEQQRERKFSEKPHKSVNNESDSNVAFQNRSCDTTIPFTKRKKENISCESHPVCNVASINSACNTYISSKGPQGRAGNIMFEIAALIGVAKRRGFTPQSRYNHYIFKWFEMPRIYVNVPAVNEKNVGEVKYGTYQKEVESLDCGQNWTLGGYRCSWKYFNNAKDEVRKVFTLKAEFTDKANAFLQNLSSTGAVNVCVHVRRGDMAKDANIKLGYVPSDATYLNRSMEYFRNMFRKKTVHFVVISNGMEWCQNNTSGPDVFYSPFKEAVLDFALMVCCDHVIITIGTFGWWGAWLSGGITVYDSSWPTQYTFVGKGLNRSDYYPKHWIGL
ncbi:galactoside alpha-(1,2)-fucosyltransferase 2-like isoform X1 [Mya arenaria]|uniref:galactoside alpha-(1,2)-fucosyltransferase 2-like isoform X1 n=1 Tax=Mya arenaria TaxID=6604 RepID=UPI0022E2B3D9|nr:galactoside alpha-(1,2)-fucosyltransferase 2-like isoform X1 [Mya arenaria]